MRRGENRRLMPALRYGIRVLIAGAVIVVITLVFVVLAIRRLTASPSLPGGVQAASFPMRTPSGPVIVQGVGVRLTDRRYQAQPVMTGSKPLSTLGAIAAVNGDFYNLRTGAPSGRLVIGGFVENAGPSAEPSLVLAGSQTRIAKRAPLAGDLISGKPRLIVNGQLFTRFILDGATARQANAPAPRTAVCLCGGWIWLYVAPAPGVTLSQWQLALLGRGCDQALNLDGGPSSGLVEQGRLVTGSDAAVPTALVIAKSSTG